MTYRALTNEVGYITDIPWLLGIYRSKTTPSPSGCALGFGVVFDNKSLQPWYNYYLAHACVATLAALAGEMAGMCDTWLSLVRTYLLMHLEIWLY